jgi:hypothetical protein
VTVVCSKGERGRSLGIGGGDSWGVGAAAKCNLCCCCSVPWDGDLNTEGAVAVWCVHGAEV